MNKVINGKMGYIVTVCLCMCVFVSFRGFIHLNKHVYQHLPIFFAFNTVLHRTHGQVSTKLL